MEKYIRFTIVTVFCAFFLLSGCKSLPADTTASVFLGREVRTATNLHVFDDKNIYWQNYINGVVLPAGTVIRFSEVNVRYATFFDNYNQKFFFYWRGEGEGHADTFEKEFEKYFSLQDPSEEIVGLPEDIRKAIELGEVRRGMPKRAVLLSWGRPPHGADIMKEDMWKYMTSQGDELFVYFEDGNVIHIDR